MIVIDASAVFDILIDRGRGDAVTAEIRKHKGLWAPELILVEVASALWRLARTGRLTEREADRAVGLLGQIPVTLIGHRQLLTGAWSARKSLRISDAFYAGCAHRLDLPLLTTDSRMARAVEGDIDVVLLT